MNSSVISLCRQHSGGLYQLLVLLLLTPGFVMADGMEAPPKTIKPPASSTSVDTQAPATAPSAATKTGNTSPLDSFELAKYQYCGEDSDCTVAINGCCDCVNGGVEVGINRDRYEAFRARFDCLHVECTNNPANPPCESGVVSCINHRCRYFDDRGGAEGGAK